MRILFSAFLTVFALAGCSQRVTDANLHEVKPDMSTKEVESILGPPMKVESPPELKLTEVKTLPVTRYIYQQNGKVVTLTFVGDHLASGSGAIEGSFDK